MLGTGIFRQIDQLGQRRQRRQLRRKLLCSLCRELTQPQSFFVDPVSREHTRPAAIGDHRQTLTDRAIARGQALGRRVQLDEGVHAHGTRAAQRGIEHLVAADDRTAVRERRRIACRLAPGL